MNFALLGPLIALFSAALGVWLGLWFAKTGMQTQVQLEKQLAAIREQALRDQVEALTVELIELRPKAFELARLQEQLIQEQAKYTQMKTDLDNAFKAAATDVLRANTQSFLALAKQELGAQTQQASSTLTEKENAIQTMLKPITDTLRQLDEQTRGLETSRAGAYSELKTLVQEIGRTIPDSLNLLKNETTQLVSALRSPKTRGNWGELQLRRCVEFAGMVDHCSFREQVSTLTVDDQRLQPDMTVQMPNGRTIVVDAKTPSDLFSAEAPDPATARLRLEAHAARVKAHLRDLSAKAYWKQFDSTPEFVVCFLPSEALFSAALEADPGLIEFSAQSNVVMATPTTLIALLKAVAYGWQQSEITKNAEAIQETGRDLYGKLVNAYEYFEKLGSALQNTVSQYNKFVGAVEGRGGAFFQARKLGRLVHDGQQLEITEPIAAEPRVLTAEDWNEPLALAAEAGDPIEAD